MLTFYIVDDDVSVRRVLSNIISSKGLGRVIGETDNGSFAYRAILELKPDIVLMDLLIPGMDGIETIKMLRQAKSHSNFIMISQVDAKDMITLAYQSGIEFYIHKPINIIEVVSVIDRVKELINLKKSLSIIHRTVENISPMEYASGESMHRPSLRTIDAILSDLGITGEAGSMDIKKTLELIQDKKNSKGKYYNYKLSSMYEILSDHYMQEGEPYQSSSGIKAIEQRIRRAVAKALQNIATMGIENPDNPKFIKYSTCLFDFKEVKQEMDFLRNNSCYHGKINVKKFLEGIMLELLS